MHLRLPEGFVGCLGQDFAVDFSVSFIFEIVQERIEPGIRSLYHPVCPSVRYRFTLKDETILFC